MTTVPVRRGLRRPVDEQIEADVARELKKIKGKTYGVEFFIEPRCRVCQHEDSRALVNRMLAHAMSYPEIVRICELSINPSRAKNNKINYRSVRWHARNHFNIEEPAKAIYRGILERRAAEAEQAVDGVVRLVTAMGYLDVMAQKGYETLVKDDTYISPALGMDAVVKLHEMTRKAAGAQEIAELRQQLAVIQSAVKEVVPQEFWAQIVARIEYAEGRMATPVDVEVLDDYDDYGDDDEPYSPPIEADVDDSLED